MNRDDIILNEIINYMKDDNIEYIQDANIPFTSESFYIKLKNDKTFCLELKTFFGFWTTESKISFINWKNKNEYIQLDCSNSKLKEFTSVLREYISRRQRFVIEKQLKD